MKQDTTPGRRALRAAADAGKAAASAARAALDADPSTEPRSDTPTDSEREADGELSAAFESLPEGSVYSAWKFTESGDKAWCAEGPVADFSPATIGQDHGGGKYVVYFRKLDSKGRKQPAGSRRFVVAGSVKPRAANGAAPAASGLDLQAQQLFQSYAEMVQASTKATLDSANMLQTMQAAVVKSMLDGRQAPDSTATILEAIKALTPLILPLLGSKGSGGFTPELMLQIIDRQARQGDPGLQLKQTLGLLAQARELVGEGAGGDGAPAWMAMVEKGLGLIQTAMEQKRTGAIGPGAPDATPPAETVSRETPTPGAGAVPTDPYLRELAPYLPQLITHAEANHDPDTYARVILDSVPPGYYSALAGWVAAPDTLDLIVKTWPQVQPVRPWFHELLTAIGDILKDPAEGEE